MILKDIIEHLESIAPLAFQESYDNSGLLVGDKNWEIGSALISLDITEEVIAEAINKGCKLIICHHPLIFKGIKRIIGGNLIERCLITAIKHDIAIYAAHTNLDSITGGVNSKICEKIGLINCQVLAPVQNQLIKLITFVPQQHLEKVRNAIFEAGAGVIGHYDQCSFGSEGTGSFRADQESNPFVGKRGILHLEPEVRLETILPRHLSGKVVAALKVAHPYEEVAYDLVPVENDYPTVGIGMVGELSEEMGEIPFLLRIKELFGCAMIKHTALLNKGIRRVAVCGGSGSFLVGKAISAGADLFISADFKYHDFFDADKRIILADLGHYESEQFTKEVLREIVLKKFPTFALHLSDVKTNPVSYL